MRAIAALRHGSDRLAGGDILAAARRLVEREHMVPRDLVVIGAEDPDLAAACRRIGFADIAFAAPSAIPSLGGGDGITLAIPSRGPIAAALARAGEMQAVILPPLDGKRLAASDRMLFDRGLLRLARGADERARLYRRSCAIAPAAATGGDTRATVAMSSLGHNAGFANQLFQYAFLRLYGLRNNCAIETPAWIGETLYGFPARRVARPRRAFKGDPWSVRDLALWTVAKPPVEVDFWGYFQNPPASWRRHRAFLRRAFTPLPPWREPVERWLERNVPAGATLVALHLRRGDYRTYAAAKPWFRLIPEEWYRQFLARLWPSLKNPVLFIASDERASVIPAFADYAPLVADEIEASSPEPGYLADFEILARADVLAIANSSFSRMAALLAPDSQRCFIPSPASASLEPYDPWAPDDFWQRFGAPTTPTRPRLPRWLRRPR